jgi:hypothetical protein
MIGPGLVGVTLLFLGPLLHHHPIAPLMGLSPLQQLRRQGPDEQRSTPIARTLACASLVSSLS